MVQSRVEAAAKDHTFCGGTSKVFVRRSTETNLSMHGRMKKIPEVGKKAHQYRRQHQIIFCGFYIYTHLGPVPFPP